MLHLVMSRRSEAGCPWRSAADRQAPVPGLDGPDEVAALRALLALR